jgi:hypothetical protein
MSSQPLTLDMKPLAQIAKLKEDNETLQMEMAELQRRVKFMELSKNEDTQQIMNLKYENLKLQEDNNDLRMENRALKRQANAMDQMDSIDLDTEDEEQMEELEENMEVPQLIEIPFVDPDNRQKFNCTICGKEYTQEKRLHTHLIKKHNYRPARPAPKAYNCNVCKFGTNHLPSYNRHTKAHANGVIPCPVENCKYESPYNKRMINHMIKKHCMTEDDIETMLIHQKN